MFYLRGVKEVSNVLHLLEGHAALVNLLNALGLKAVHELAQNNAVLQELMDGLVGFLGHAGHSRDPLECL
jgi:hypothetical protein